MAHQQPRGLCFDGERRKASGYGQEYLGGCDVRAWPERCFLRNGRFLRAHLAGSGGSLSAKTLTAIHDNVECPSISPDGTRIAFKKNAGGALAAHWKVAILELATGQQTVLSEKRSVDDQIEWLDNRNLLYGLAADGGNGDSNIWKLGTDPTSQPSLFIAHGWSPSVVR